jgi:predicted nucleic-acid-binding Zn-ribbon protein
MNEVKKCPKCGGQMEIGHLDGTYNWNKGKTYIRLRHGPRIWGYACENCGYVEFYVEGKVLSHDSR